MSEGGRGTQGDLDPGGCLDPGGGGDVWRGQAYLIIAVMEKECNSYLTQSDTLSQYCTLIY